jgi:DNA-directed RNA polymerase II subunit RPB1
VKVNNQLQRDINNGSPPHVISDGVKMLQYHCATLVNNELPSLPQVPVILRNIYISLYL